MRCITNTWVRVEPSATPGAWKWLRSLCAVVLLIVGGCTAPARQAYNASEAERAQIVGFENIRVHADDPRPPRSVYDPWRPVTNKPKPAMLAISGGGAGGAFSVGILSAWSELGTRPSFDVVTGVSTGALIAPLAFLGSTPHRTTEIRRPRWWANDPHGRCGKS